jgi:hypothetical protein
MKSLNALLVAVFLVCVSADAEEVSEVGKPAKEDQREGNQKAPAKQPPQPIVLTVTVPPKTPEDLAEERANRAEDTKIQRDVIDTNKELARYTLRAVWISIFVGMVAIVQAIFSKRSADAAKRSANVAEQALIATSRPWIDIEIGLLSDLAFVADGAEMTFEVRATNIGKGPAIACEFYHQLEAFPKRERQDLPGRGQVDFNLTEGPELRKWCDGLRGSPLRNAGFDDLQYIEPYGFTLFPHAEESMVITCSIPYAAIQQARGERNSSYWFVFKAAVDYRFPSHRSGGITGKVVTILKLDPAAAGGVMQFTDEAGLIPRAQLSVQPAWASNTYAL